MLETTQSAPTTHGSGDVLIWNDSCPLMRALTSVTSTKIWASLVVLKGGRSRKIASKNWIPVQKCRQRRGSDPEEGAIDEIFPAMAVCRLGRAAS